MQEESVQDANIVNSVLATVVLLLGSAMIVGLWAMPFGLLIFLIKLVFGPEAVWNTFYPLLYIATFCAGMTSAQVSKDQHESHEAKLIVGVILIALLAERSQGVTFTWHFAASFIVGLLWSDWILERVAPSLLAHQNPAAGR